LPVHDIYKIQVFAFKIIHDDACHTTDQDNEEYM